MCNLSQGILEQGIDIGEGKGYIKAIKELVEKGLTDEQIKELHEATDEQIKAAKKLCGL